MSEKQKRTVKIVITGGPCAGKSTAIRDIKEYFTDKGYKVLCVGETATELISGGVAPWTCPTNTDYQKLQISLQLAKEKVFDAAAAMSDSDVLIIYDRAMLDNRAYMTEEDFISAIREHDLTREALLNSYDAVFHLETAAKGAQDAYTTANNSARTESPEYAIEVDNRTVNAWESHKYFRIIDNSTDFEHKIKRLLNEIELFLNI